MKRSAFLNRMVREDLRDEEGLKRPRGDFPSSLMVKSALPLLGEWI